jgi:putative chitinase
MWFWAWRGLNELADTGDFEKITRIINGGTNGLTQRLALYEQAKDALEVTA